MALNTRLTQNIDLQADSGTLVKALGSIETMLNSIVKQGGSLGKALDDAGKKGKVGFDGQLKSLNLLIAQAQNLTKILDAQKGQKANKLFGAIDEQAIGRKGAAASRLAQDLSATSTAADVLEKRLATLNKRFAEMTLAGRTVGQKDLAKQLRTQEALKDVQGLERAFQRLNGQVGSGRGTTEQKNQIASLRLEIEKANSELVKMGQGRRIDFTPQITQIRQLTDQYRQAVAAAVAYDRAQPGRTQTANRSAVSILNQTDSQRLAEIRRNSSQFQFPTGISNAVSQQSAENKLADSLNKRLRLLNMIQQAQDRGAPTRSVERLNEAYTRLGLKLGENFKLLQQINTELNRQQKGSFLGQVQSGLGRAGIITGASIAVTGVYAVMNAVKEATRFVIEYEAALKQLQAISGSTDSQMSVLAESIGKVGRNSTYSLLEITKAATVIAQAGYSASETGKVLNSAINLSTASGSDPSQAVEVLTAALGAFQLQASESDRVVDTLVTGLNRSKLSIEQMGSAIQYAGATANEAGVRFEELTTIAASMANAGIKSGSTIGTGIRQLLVDMQTPSEDFKKELQDVGLTLADVDVKAKGFAGVVRTLADAGFTAEAAYASFETRAAAAFLAFKGQIGGYDELALAIAQGGAAAEAQANAMDSLSAQWNRLKNDLGTISAALAGPLLSSLKVVTTGIANLTEAIIDIFAGLGQLIGGFGDLNAILFTIGSASIGSLFGPIGTLVGLFIGLTSAIGSAGSEFEELRTKTSDAEAQFNSSKDTVGNLDKAIIGLIDRQGSLKDNSIALQTETVTLAERFGDLYTYLGKAAGSYDELLNAMLRYRGEAIKQQGYDADTLKTNSQIQLDAAQKNLSETSYGSYYQQRQVGMLPAASGIQDRVKSALSSNDISVLTPVTNEVATLNAKSNGAYRNVLKMLQERLALVKEISALKGKVDNATRQGDLARELSGADASSRFKSIVKITNGVNSVVEQTKGGNYSRVDSSIADLDRGIAALKDQLKQYKVGSAKYLALQDDISKVEAQHSRLVRIKREKAETDAKVRPERAQKGTTMTGTQVKAEILKRFPNANVYSEKPRSLAKQKELYAAYKAGRGPLAAKPGTSNHGTGNAIDVTPIPGMTLDDLVSYVEGLGLEVTERLNERNPTTGGYHWHVAWKAKSSSFGKQQESAFNSLKKAQASQAVGASSSKIAALLAQAKAGTGNPDELRGQLKMAALQYSNASLAQYDTDNPAAGLSGDALKVQQLGRQQLVEKLTNDVAKFFADFQRAVGDATAKTLAAANKAIDDALTQETYNNQAGVRAVESRIAVSQNKNNRGRTDAGTSYYLQQQQEAAQIQADRMQVVSLNNTATSKDFALNQYISTTPKGEEGSEERAAYDAQVASRMAEINDLLRERDILQQKVNDSTAAYVALPLNERVKSAGQTWLENSGAMKDWSAVIADNVGPALDMLTSSLTSSIEGVMKGTMTIKQALGNILKSIGEFIIQMIAKALALQAVKWLLALVGIQVPDTPTVGLLKGGSVKPKKMMAGGSTGYINQGVINKDTVPILGARGEYMLNSRAVKDIGVENVEQMNQHGSKAVARMAGAVPVPVQSRQEVNVYVVKPEEKPQLSKNDIVLAVTDDMLQGGQTKQLVRQISQGA